ncbi:MAG: hypothetical protein WCO54_08135 [Bacteroidota bacterium]
MKNLIIRSAFLVCLSGVMLSCGSSKVAEAERKNQELKQKQDKLDQDKKRFEMQNNKDLK